MTIYICVLLSLTPAVLAQLEMMPRSADDWQTIHTDHFHVHFSPEVEAWTMQLIPKLESIHSAVVQMVGYYHINDYVDVFIVDPMGIANGMAIPVKTRPRIILWPDAPVDPLMLGGLETWHEIVMVHEYTHAVHLSRNSNSLPAKIISAILPIKAMSLKLPMWVTEGYAVLIESELTGYGRTQSSLRSMLLTQLAIEGKLPPYASLNGGDFLLGGRYPYLVGSAFLEWLRDRHGDPDCLQHLWKRVSARQARKFDEAFLGVFQDSPEDLYDRFRAELTAEAMRFETELSRVGVVEGDQWQSIEGLTGQPAISPDGESMAVMITRWGEKPCLHVWSTIETAEKQPDPALKDPDDVPALSHEPDKRKELYTLKYRHGIRPSAPRWMPDGESLIFHALRQRPIGDYRSDIYRWWPESDGLERITTGASLSWCDPCPDGIHAICLYKEYGLSGIMKLNLETGAVTALVEPALQPVWQSPRVSPDGSAVVVIGRENHRSELFTFNLTNPVPTSIHYSEREVVLSPAWSKDSDEIFFCSDANGVMNVTALRIHSGETRYLSRSLAGLISLETASAQKMLYLVKPHSKGMDIYTISSDASLAETNFQHDFDRVQPPVSVDLPQEFSVYDHSDKSAYKPAEHLEYGWLLSGNTLPWQHSIEAGFWTGDILGRLRFLAIGGYGFDGGPTGGSLGLQYQGLPVASRLKLFYVERDPSDQTKRPDLVSGEVDWSTTGGEVDLFWDRHLTNGSFGCNGGLAAGRVDRDDSAESFDRYIGGVELQLNGYGNVSKFAFGGACTMSGITGLTDDDSWFQYQCSAVLFAGWANSQIRCEYRYGETSGDHSVFDSFRSTGYDSSIEPHWFNRNRINTPWLPDSSLQGDNYEQLTVELSLGAFLPFTLFGTELNMWNDHKPDPQRVVGARTLFSLPTLALVRFDACDFEAGVVYGIDGLIEDKWRGYVTFRYYP